MEAITCQLRTFLRPFSKQALYHRLDKHRPRFLSVCTCLGSLKFVPKSSTPKQEEISVLQDFVRSSRNLMVITGAGISTESGIRDYRSEGVGLYATSNQRPIEFQDFVRSAKRRQRYWVRNFVAWPMFSSFQPNDCHRALASMERAGRLHWLVTQNVDSLHRLAGSQRLTELHGTAERVSCMQCHRELTRSNLQRQLIELNPDFKVLSDVQAPDGDVVVPDELVDGFRMVDCKDCGGILKPKIVFFGENVPATIKEDVYSKLELCDALLVVGSSLQVFSSFRFVMAAREQRKPIAILNIGPTRGDKMADVRVSAMAGHVLPKLLNH